MSSVPTPTQIILHKKSRTLEVVFDNNENFVIPCAFLRVHSPSAESKGKTLVDKENVNILSVEPVGQYAVKLIFSDGHSTGIYSWQTLYELGMQHRKN